MNNVTDLQSFLTMLSSSKEDFTKNTDYFKNVKVVVRDVEFNFDNEGKFLYIFNKLKNS